MKQREWLRVELKRLHEIHRIVVEGIELLIEKGGWDRIVLVVERGKKGGGVVRRLRTALGRVQQNLAVLRQNEDAVSLPAQHDAVWDVVELGIKRCGKAVFGDEEGGRRLGIGVNREELYGAVEEAWE